MRFRGEPKFKELELTLDTVLSVPLPLARFILPVYSDTNCLMDAIFYLFYHNYFLQCDHRFGRLKLIGTISYLITVVLMTKFDKVGKIRLSNLLNRIFSFDSLRAKSRKEINLKI
jgi:hypothetical protein